MSETVLVAGASGMLGRQVTRALQRGGMRVRALTRDPDEFARRCAAVDEVVAGDATAPAQTVSAVAGVRAVISCAAPAARAAAAVLRGGQHDGRGGAAGRDAPDRGVLPRASGGGEVRA